MPVNDEDDAPQVLEVGPETPVFEPAAKPATGPTGEKVSSASRSERSDNVFTSKEKAKMFLEKWLALSFEEN